MAMGGTGVAWAADPLGAMAANPAGLGFLTAPEVDLGIFEGFAQGDFDKGTVHGDLNNSFAGLPEAAFGIPLKEVPVSFGVSVIPDSILLADWNFIDPPSTPGNITYGPQEHKSEILVLRSAVGAAVSITPKLSLGFNLGLIYNENTLIAPYTFQSQPVLKGAKTLLDLNTSGFGWNIGAGVLYRPLTNLQFGVSYKSEARVTSSGTATGDAYAQFALPPGSVPFHYDAEVRNVFPQEVNFGLSWRFHPQWRLALETDWLNWASAFHTLPVRLSNGSNGTINSVVGSSSLSDNIPLNWQNEFVYRAGLECAVTENFYLRGGYAFGKSPVPDSTLTPMTAAIMENTLTLGIGYHYGRCKFDLAYQYDLPETRNVGTSGLLSGEYSNSSTRVSIQWIALTVGVQF